MNINPKEVIDRQIITACEFTEIQQVGIDLTVSEDISLEHSRAYNVLFNESIALPDDMFATIQQRSSYSRKGIFITTGVYDPGYGGSLGCTIYNMSGEAIKIDRNTRIAQIVVFEANPASSYNGQWQGK